MGLALSSVSRFPHRVDVSEAASVGVRKPWVRWLLYTCTVTVRPVASSKATSPRECPVRPRVWRNRPHLPKREDGRVLL